MQWCGVEKVMLSSGDEEFRSWVDTWQTVTNRRRSCKVIWRQDTNLIFLCITDNTEINVFEHENTRSPPKIVFNGILLSKYYFLSDQIKWKDKGWKLKNVPFPFYPWCIQSELSLVKHGQYSKVRTVLKSWDPDKFPPFRR